MPSCIFREVCVRAQRRVLHTVRGILYPMAQHGLAFDRRINQALFFFSVPQLPYSSISPQSHPPSLPLTPNFKKNPFPPDSRPCLREPLLIFVRAALFDSLQMIPSPLVNRTHWLRGCAHGIRGRRRVCNPCHKKRRPAPTSPLPETWTNCTHVLSERLTSQPCGGALTTSGSTAMLSQ